MTIPACAGPTSYDTGRRAARSAFMKEKAAGMIRRLLVHANLRVAHQLDEQITRLRLN